MQTANDVIVHAISTAKMMGKRFSDDLKGNDWVHRPTPKSNCAAWTLGHLVLSNRSAATALGANDLPPLPDGFEKRFSREEGCPQAGDFGDTSQLIALYEQSCDQLADTVRRASPEQLSQPTERQTPMFKNRGELATFMALHAATHIGQIMTIRRSLGRTPLI